MAAHPQMAGRANSQMEKEQIPKPAGQAHCHHFHSGVFRDFVGDWTAAARFDHTSNRIVGRISLYLDPPKQMKKPTQRPAVFVSRETGLR